MSPRTSICKTRSSKRGSLYRLEDPAAKKAAKFDRTMEAQARDWVNAIAGPLGEGTLQQELKSGVVLCNLVNAIKPGCCRKPSPSAMPFKQMENIANYLDACAALGMPRHSSFQTVTLYEAQDMMQVLTNLHALGAIAQQRGHNGPTLGVKLAEANARAFTEEQLRAGRAEQTFICKGSSQFASACSVDRSQWKDIDKMRHVLHLAKKTACPPRSAEVDTQRLWAVASEVLCSVLIANRKPFQALAVQRGLYRHCP